MPHNDFSCRDQRLVVALHDVFLANGGQAMSYRELHDELQRRGVKVPKSGLGRTLDGVERRLAGESAVGRLLLHRTRSSGSRPTEQLARLAADCRAYLDRLGESRRRIDSGRELLRIGSIHAATTNMIPRLLMESGFHERFPKVDVRLIVGAPQELVGLMLPRFDFGISSECQPGRGCECETVAQRKRVLLYNYEHTYRQNFWDLEQQMLRVQSDEERGRLMLRLQAWLRDEAVIVPEDEIIPRMREFLKPPHLGRIDVVPNAATRRIWVQRRMGVALSHEERPPQPHSAGSHAPPGPHDQVREIDLSSELGSTRIMLIRRRNHALSPAARFLIAEFLRIFREVDPSEALSAAASPNSAEPPQPPAR